MKYIDIHSHAYFPDYDEDREAVISRALDAKIGIITVGVDLESSQKSIMLAESHENMWATVGLHPADLGNSDAPAVPFDYETFKKLAQHPKVVAIGECGLDYFHSPGNSNRQRETFIQHILLANEVNKPLMLHVRNGKNTPEDNAYQDALILLKKYASVRANFHFFAGTVSDLNNIIDAGYSVSFTGVVTFARDYDKLVRSTPIDRIMTETDAPFVSPIPYRSKRNESLHVIEIANKIAEIRGENPDTVLPALVSNAKKFFCI